MPLQSGAPTEVDSDLKLQLLKPLENWDSIPTTGDYLEPRVWGPHGGIDKACWLGTPVLAMHAGVVARRDYGERAYGLAATVHHRDLDVFTRYAHGQEFLPAAPDGEWVEAGTPLMLSGTSGNSTGPHLHVEGRRISTGATFDIGPLLVDALPDADAASAEAAQRSDYAKMLDAMADLGFTIRALNRAGRGVVETDRGRLTALNEKWIGKI